MDDRQPNHGLPSGMNRDLASTTTSTSISHTRGPRRGGPARPERPRTRTKPSNQRLDRPRSFMDDTTALNCAQLRRTALNGVVSPQLRLLLTAGRATTHRFFATYLWEQNGSKAELICFAFDSKVDYRGTTPWPAVMCREDLLWSSEARSSGFPAAIPAVTRGDVGEYTLPEPGSVHGCRSQDRLRSPDALRRQGKSNQDRASACAVWGTQRLAFTSGAFRCCRSTRRRSCGIGGSSGWTIRPRRRARASARCGCCAPRRPGQPPRLDVAVVPVVAHEWMMRGEEPARRIEQHR
jgi:hypothetical protein